MMEEANSILILIALGGMGIAYGMYNFIMVYIKYNFKVLAVRPRVIISKTTEDEQQKLIMSSEKSPELTQEQVDKLEAVSQKISSGANVFLCNEYFFMFLFILLFGCLIAYTAEHKRGTYYTTIAFVTGAFTSILCGYIGMMIATSSNYRTCYKA
jgi:hypothetical protein